MSNITLQMTGTWYADYDKDNSQSALCLPPSVVCASAVAGVPFMLYVE